MSWLFIFSKSTQAPEGPKQIQFFASHPIDSSALNLTPWRSSRTGILRPRRTTT